MLLLTCINMSFNKYLKKMALTINKIKFTPLGIIVSKSKLKTFKKTKNLLILRNDESIGEILTEQYPICFTVIGNSIYYGCWNIDKKCYQVRRISSKGIESIITDSNTKVCLSYILEMNTTKDNVCVVLAKESMYHKECLLYLNPDGSTDIITDCLNDPKEFIVTEDNTFLLIDQDGIQEINSDGTCLRRIVSINNPFFRPNLYNLVCTHKSFLVVNERKIIKYKREKMSFYCTNSKMSSKSGEKIFGEQNFIDLNIGPFIKNFYLTKNGRLTILTNNAFYRIGDSCQFPNPEIIYDNSNELWNPKLIRLIKLSKQSYLYARIFMLCMNRIYERDESIPDVPIELFHLMLSHSDTWRFPGKKLNLL